MKTHLTIAALAQRGRASRAVLVLVACAVAAALTAIAGGTVAGSSKPSIAVAGKKATLSVYGKLPLSFVANAGRLDRRVRYSAQAGGAGFYFTKREAVFSFPKGKKKGLALRLRFPGADPRVQISGARPASGKVNYLIGYDPAGWHTNLPTYGELVYHDLWPGIDLHFRGEHGQLKYEFLVKPGADPKAIGLAYRGVERLSLDKRGNLRLQTALGTLVDSRPVSHQQRDGRLVPVASRFLLTPARRSYRFTIGAYDRSRPLIIDPGLVYSTYLGGSGAIAVDSAGNAYVTGSTASADFPTTAGAFDTSFNGGSDAFVTKLNAAGSALLYSTFLGGGDYDAGFGIAVNDAGDAYVTGFTNSTTFPTTQGAFDTSFDNNGDAFVTKLNASGSDLLYSTFLGGGGGESGHGLAVDGAGDAYVTGATYSADFPTTAGAFDTSFNGSPLQYCVQDAFVTKLNAAGSELLYSTYLGGSCAEWDAEIAVDGAGDAYVTGSTASGDFPTTSGAFDTSNLGQDAFVTKLNATGSDLLYSTYLGARDVEASGGIAVDGAGSAYVTGTTYSADFPTTEGVVDSQFNGGSSDAYVTKLNADGSRLLYSTYLGGSTFLFRAGSDNGVGIALDAAGDAYVTGTTYSADFPTTAGAFDSTLNAGGSYFGNNGADAFVTKLNAIGSKLLYSTYLGGTVSDRGAGIAVDGAGAAYVTGGTLSTDFPATAGAFDRSYNGGPDGEGFVAKLDPRAPPLQPACVVPRVIGLRLAKAKIRIRRARCRVGRVRRAQSRKRVGRVVKQSPRARSRRAGGTRVNLVVGRR